MTLAPSWSEPALAAELSRDEGQRPRPYRDTRGILTVGVGHNLVAKPLPNEVYPMSEARMDEVLAEDVAGAASELDYWMGWWRGLSPVRQRVMLNMTFNLGIGTFRTFHVFLELVRRGDYADASSDMLGTLWASQVGDRAKRLSVMMTTG